ncbi:unnamed protein product [Clavelina lepadiformis]|uniref:Uncharacterized protein n=1 Tax=Clavelina lepadiformis TaxID=159417 RepID=A0ABP0FBP3_CLALP
MPVPDTLRCGAIIDWMSIDEKLKKMQDSCCSQVARPPNTLSIVPTIHFTDSDSNESDILSTSPKRIHIPKKQFFRSNGEPVPGGKHFAVPPSPLSTSPDSHSSVTMRNHRFMHGEQNHLSRHPMKQKHLGFVPIMVRGGSAGEEQSNSSGNESEDSLNGEIEFHQHPTERHPVTNKSSLHPNLLHSSAGKAQFRRHSWIW